jgi:uncharacterized protein (TIGR02145 family)
MVPLIACVKSNKEKALTNESKTSVIADIPVTKIGDQVWRNNNLDADTFRNGDTIPHAKTAAEWREAAEKEEPAWCYYNNMNLEGRPIGKLYNWYAVNDSRGLAPIGWKIPSVKDWMILYNYRGPDEGKLPIPPTASRSSKGEFKKGGFGYVSMCWSTTESKNHGNAMFVHLITVESSHPNYMSNPEMISAAKGAGLSVRCLKD